MVDQLTVAREVRELTGRVNLQDPALLPGVSDLLATWATVGPHLEAQLAARARRGGSLLVMDAFSHELDLAEALGVAPPAEHPAYGSSLSLLTKGFDASVRGHGLPALTIVTPGEQWQAGDGTPEVSVNVSSYQVIRMLTGRLSIPALRALDWSADPTPWLPAFTWGLFTPSPS